ncbi:MAG: glycogen synthase [Gammaproteobacteria bacterium]
MVSSEVAPLAKTGGLADVSAALVRYLSAAGHDVRLLTPCYDVVDPALIESEPVPELQDLRMDLGDESIHYAIDATPLPDRGPAVYLLRCPALFDRGRIYTGDHDDTRRFTVLSRAAIEMCQHMGWSPHIMHCNDWHTALIPVFLKTLYQWDRLFAATRSVLAIHNIAYQGVTGTDRLEALGLDECRHLLDENDLAAGRVNFLRTGIRHADLITTVSPGYAREIRTDEGGMGLAADLRARPGRVVGILNGVDYRVWDPRNDPLLPIAYSAKDLSGKREGKQRFCIEQGMNPDPDLPLAGVVSRFTWQKGIDLMREVLPRFLERGRLQLAVLGAGEEHYESFFHTIAERYRGRVFFHCGYSEVLAHRIEAAADMFLMPSAFEPCGLNQMYSLRYGTVPIVRATGGLADSVHPFDPDSGEGTGIVFEHFDAGGLRWALETALALYEDRAAWRKLQRNGMREDFSWERQTARYVALFRELLAETEPPVIPSR